MVHFCLKNETNPTYLSRKRVWLEQSMVLIDSAFAFVLLDKASA